MHNSCRQFERFCLSNLGMQEWRSSESARLPPLWPGFDSGTRRHIWIEFVVASRPCSEGFFPVFRFSSLHKYHNSKFQFDLEIWATGLSALFKLMNTSNWKNDFK